MFNISSISVLVKWSGLPSTFNTWDTALQIQAMEFHLLILWTSYISHFFKNQVVHIYQTPYPGQKYVGPIGPLIWWGTLRNHIDVQSLFTLITCRPSTDELGILYTQFSTPWPQLLGSCNSKFLGGWEWSQVELGLLEVHLSSHIWIVIKNCCSASLSSLLPLQRGHSFQQPQAVECVC